MKHAKLFLIAGMTGLMSICVNAQDSKPLTMDSVTKSLNKLNSELDVLKRIKVSGYTQPQFQYIDSAGAASYEGGNFGANVNKRFMIRESRLRVAYETSLSQFVFQFDVSERGFAIKDMYAKITEPWCKAFTLTVGSMNRPFGFEIPFSSVLRESPDRARMSQIIFPGERDLGAMITFQMPKGSALNFLKLDGGIYNGTGNGAVDFDTQKDIISHLSINRETNSKKFAYGLGASFYDGAFRQGRKNVYSLGTDSVGTTTGYVDNSDTLNYGRYAKRQYIGADFQFTYNGPIGATTIRAEYVQGKQPGTSSSSTSPSVAATSDIYLRDFSGAYFYFTQNIFKTKHQIVVKYDWYDPNTKIEGDQLGKSVTGGNIAKTGTGDVKYTTLGFGYICNWSANVRYMLYYDMVTNETSKNLSGYTKDLKDNVFTARVQYKF